MRLLLDGFVVCGGKLRPPFTLCFTGEPPVTHDDMMRNVESVRGLGLPSHRMIKAASPRLAVVGGGPSINNHVDALKGWDGEIWAINGAFGWCQDREIESTFFAIDPHPIVKNWCGGAKRALIVSRADPVVFEALRDADVYVFDVNDDGEGAVRIGSSTATAAPILSVIAGFQEVTFFGCESSYNMNVTHAYAGDWIAGNGIVSEREPREQEMAIACNSSLYLTAPDYYVQALELAQLIREFPSYLKERSGGLLGAMVASDDHRIVWVSDGLMASIKPFQAAAE